MRSGFLVICFLTSCVPLLAQHNTYESLGTALSKAEQDTTRVLLLSQLSKAYRDSKPDSALLLAQQGLQLAQKLKFIKGEAECLLRVAYVYFINWADAIRATELCFIALKKQEDVHDKKGIAATYVLLNDVYNYNPDTKLGLHDSRLGLGYGLKAEKILTGDVTDDETLTDAYQTIGIAYALLQRPDSSLEYLTKCYLLAQRLGKIELIGTALSKLGWYYQKFQENTLALEYFRKAYSIHTALNNGIYRAHALYFIGEIHHRTGHKDSALFYINQALAASKAANFQIGIVSSSEFLARFYEGHNDKEAVKFYKQANAIRDSFFSLEKTNQWQNLIVTENLRQRVREEEKQKAKEERAHNLQYAAIALGLVGFFILFLLFSYSILANQKLIRFLGVIFLLILFEFLNLLLHPYLGELTHHSPVLMLLIMVCIASLLVPLHHRMEHWVTHRLVEKNNRIRLAAAKRTIEQLEEKGSVAADKSTTPPQTH